MSEPHDVLNRPDGQEDDMLDADEAEEEIPSDPDAPMEGEDDDEDDENAPIAEIQLQNDSVAHFDAHNDSVFCIAQHPLHPEIIATGSGDEVGYIFDSTPTAAPTNQDQSQPAERASLTPLHKITGHSDSLNALTFTLPSGEYLVTAGLDGRITAHHDKKGNGRTWTPLSEAREVDELNFCIPCPHPSFHNTVALGASDGSVWVYTINAGDAASPLNIVQAFYMHTSSCTAGAWSPDGKLLATVSDDGSLYVWDVFGEAAAAGITSAFGGGQAVVGLTAEDERFRVEGGLYSVAISPNGALCAVGGAEGQIRIAGLPRLSVDPASATSGQKSGAGAKAKAGGAKNAAGPKGAGSGGNEPSAGQAGAILASLQTQAESVETIAFAPPPLTLMAAGSVDGSIALFDVAHRFAVRRHIKEAHEGEAVIKVEFLKVDSGGSASSNGGWVFTSCGNDGVIRRWDARGGSAAAGHGFLGEWRGHRGGGEGGGVLGFVQGGQGGRYVVTAGDDGVSLVFDTSETP